MTKIEEHFREHGLRHNQQMYDRKMREFKRGEAIEVFVFEKGELIREKYRDEIIRMKYSI